MEFTLSQKASKACLKLRLRRASADVDIISHLQSVGALAAINTPDSHACPVWAQSVMTLEREGNRRILSVRSKIWYKVNEIPTKFYRPLCDSILASYCPDSALYATSHWTPSTFYECVHTPDQTQGVMTGIQHSEVEAQLYPFQQRTVDWLLKREGCQLNGSGQIEQIDAASRPDILSFEKSMDTTGDTYYSSTLLQRVIRRPSDVSLLHQGLRGGILAEEVGLGKTVELIDLICLHRRKQDLQTITRDAYTNTDVLVSGATLIISPSSIVQQWYNEIKKHAPSLKVMYYRVHDRNRSDIKNSLSTSDIVLTTYDVLGREINYADEQPKRNLRHEKIHLAKRSPLVEILWWRVCIDEAQMIESGTSNAAIVARRVPRCNAWAVTGTPLKKDAADLMGLLIFLRYEPFAERVVWDRMINRYRDIFHQIFSTICIRHTKAQVRQELELPSQKRIVVTVPFSAIEEQHYLQMFQNMCHSLRLSSEGAPLTDDWDPDVAADAMRTWLVRLRQTCLHPEVGVRNRAALGRKSGPLRSVEEVLEVLIDQNETSLRSEERATLVARILQGHIRAASKDFATALGLYESAFAQASAAVVECREFVRVEETAKKAKTTVIKNQVRLDTGRDGNEDDEDGNDRLASCRKRLRTALELEHMCAFFVADAHHSIGAGYTAEARDSTEHKQVEAKEAAMYERAKTIRLELLREVTAKAQTLMSRVRGKMKITVPLTRVPDVDCAGGIESRRIVRSINQLRHALNEQCEVLITWRQKLLQLLTTDFMDQEDTVETDGEEYQETLKQQDEAYVYQFALRAFISDRKEILSGQSNFLLQHETQEALKLALKGEGHSPELMVNILGRRRELRSRLDDDVSMRGLASELRSLIGNVKHNVASSSHREAEAKMLEEQYDDLQAIMTEQLKDVAALDKEIDLFRYTEEARLAFYKQLQAISDTVQAYPEGKDTEIDTRSLDKASATETKAANKLAMLRTRGRFLANLRTVKDNSEERRPCIVCQEQFDLGVLTICGHEFCKDCISTWLSCHHSCPICKRKLRTVDLHDITYKPRDIRAAEEDGSRSPHASGGSSSASSPSTSSIYSSISEEALSNIKSIELPSSSWGSKIDTIARHLIHLRASGHDNRAVVFSQYRDFLDVFSQALQSFKIGFTRITHKDGIAKFQDDSNDVNVLLLDAKSQSSGLNLTKATHVFLCEPLVNVAIELQAIARVHRIGQTRPTTVWQYIVSDSVEEAIYDLSVKRRLQHVHKSGTKSGSLSMSGSGAQTPAMVDEEARFDAANSRALQVASLKLLADGKTGGEEVAQDDLWHCLFGKTSKVSNDFETRAVLEEGAGRELRASAAMSRSVAADT